MVLVERERGTRCSGKTERKGGWDGAAEETEGVRGQEGVGAGVWGLGPEAWPWSLDRCAEGGGVLGAHG